MRNILKLSLLYIAAAFLLMSCSSSRGIAGTESSLAENGPHISFNVFYRTLQPYGRWVSYPQYGQVWIPSVGRSFQPYSTNGHWVYSEYGWTWVSDYSWGWAPFHYGRWLFDNDYGWIWVPGGEWAPAWVAWRNSPDYYGWAPLGPGVNISINIGIPAARWVFVPRHYFGLRNAYRYYVPRHRNVTIIHHTTIINNVNVYRNNRYYSGPARREVQSATHRTVRPVRVFNASRPGETRLTGNRQLNIYRPTVVRSADNSRRAPATETNTRGNKPQRVLRAPDDRHSNTARPAERTPRSNTDTRQPQTDRRTPARTSPQNNNNRNTERRAPETRPTRQPAPARRPAVRRPAQTAPSRQATTRSRQPRAQTRQVQRQVRRQSSPAGHGRSVARDNRSDNHTAPRRR